MAINYHLHTPSSNAELSKNSSTFENPEFVNQSIQEILRGGYEKTSQDNKSTFNVNRRLILDLNVSSHLYKDKIKFDYWKSFLNVLEGS